MEGILASDEDIDQQHFEKIGRIAQDLKSDYSHERDELWRGSPFEWLIRIPSRQKGAVGEKFVEKWSQASGFTVGPTGDSEADRMINGYRIEIKMSTLWTDNRIYKFQQLRDQNYDYCFCLGISPAAVHAWFIPKNALAKNRPPALVPQHGGSVGVDTKWLSFPADSPPKWLQPYGGTLFEVSKIISSIGDKP